MPPLADGLRLMVHDVLKFYVEKDATIEEDEDEDGDDKVADDTFEVALVAPSRDYGTPAASSSRAPKEDGRFMRGIKSTHHRSTGTT